MYDVRLGSLSLQLALTVMAFDLAYLFMPVSARASPVLNAWLQARAAPALPPGGGAGVGMGEGLLLAAPPPPRLPAALPCCAQLAVPATPSHPGARTTLTPKL